MGLLELKENKHIAMLFLCPSVQRKGLGRALIAAVCQHAWQHSSTSTQVDRVPQRDPLTVSASLTSVPAYMRYGFKVAGEIAESEGLKFQPMVLTF
ncbi:GNAT family N-acetyltransferase [Shewanella surugensis]|uniref:GNAT family N-acetyltransferase n=1 Tax=Shewanella surugensis TaxID=212020 RepID=A0ABT0L7I8_9GAMM|nr:GNAT family N-acetyltransferase [Shewanella surugensis]MCL1123649.1 GNAT family N-acetyltransferase [Shewanella surugensis]